MPEQTLPEINWNLLTQKEYDRLLEFNVHPVESGLIFFELISEEDMIRILVILMILMHRAGDWERPRETKETISMQAFFDWYKQCTEWHGAEAAKQFSEATVRVWNERYVQYLERVGAWGREGEPENAS